MVSDLFLVLGKIMPLYGVIGLGYLAGRQLELQRESVANLLLYVVTPIVFFGSLVSAPIEQHNLLLVPLFFTMGCVIATVFYGLGRFVYSHSERSVLGFAAGSGNTGYFGLPLVLAVLGPAALNVAIVASIGLDLFQYTLGYYFMARHQATPRAAIARVLRNPVMWAFVAGAICLRLGYHMTPALMNVADYFKGAYVVLGMLIIGLGLAQAARVRIDRRFVAGALLAKFICFPLLALVVVELDQSIWHLFSPLVHRAILLLSVVPVASDTVAFATVLKVHPDKATHTVVLSTLMALGYIPLFTVMVIR